MNVKAISMKPSQYQLTKGKFLKEKKKNSLKLGMCDRFKD